MWNRACKHFGITLTCASLALGGYACSDSDSGGEPTGSGGSGKGGATGAGGSGADGGETSSAGGEAGAPQSGEAGQGSGGAPDGSGGAGGDGTGNGGSGGEPVVSVDPRAACGIPAAVGSCDAQGGPTSCVEYYDEDFAVDCNNGSEAAEGCDALPAREDQPVLGLCIRQNGDTFVGTTFQFEGEGLPPIDQLRAVRSGCANLTGYYFCETHPDYDLEALCAVETVYGSCVNGDECTEYYSETAETACTNLGGTYSSGGCDTTGAHGFCKRTVATVTFGTFESSGSADDQDRACDLAMGDFCPLD